ncbi:MAG: hypothetical protein ABIS29_03145 [Vicinamibacterales bacterium]
MPFNTVPWNNVADIAFFTLGASLIVFALVRGKRSSANPIHYDGKFGTLKMDFVAFLVTVGILLASASLFFRWKNYETAMADLKRQQSRTEEQIRLLNEQIKSYQKFAPNVTLRFPETVDRNGLQLVPAVKKPGGAAFQFMRPLGIPKDAADASNIVSIQVPDVTYGDRLKFLVTQGNVRWISDEIEVPVFTVEMRAQ